MEDYYLSAYLGDPSASGIRPYAAHSGSVGYAFGSYFNVALTQDLPSDVPSGAMCTLQFWYMLQDSSNPGGCLQNYACYFSATVGDNKFFDSYDDPTLLAGTGSGQGNPSTDYVLLQSPPFVYTSGTQLTFIGGHHFGFIGIDDITIQCTVADESVTQQ